VRSGGTESCSGGGSAWLRFTQGPFSYVVYDGIGHWGPKGQIAAHSGVVVTRDGKVLSNHKCEREATSLLGEDWMASVGIGRNDQEFEMPE